MNLTTRLALGFALFAANALGFMLYGEKPVIASITLTAMFASITIIYPPQVVTHPALTPSREQTPANLAPLSEATRRGVCF